MKNKIQNYLVFLTLVIGAISLWYELPLVLIGKIAATILAIAYCYDLIKNDNF